jgi:hypothetical protein
MRKAILVITMHLTLMPLAYAQVDDSTHYDQEEVVEGGSDETYSEDEAEIPVTLASPEKLQSTQRYKTEEVTLKKFDSKKWKEVVGSTNYDEKKPDRPKEREKKNSTLSGGGSIPWNGAVLKPISYLLIIGIVVWILYYIVKNTSLEQKLKKTTVMKSDFEAPIENIEEIDIHSLLEQARAAGDFRLATRLYYLSILKKLNERGLIVWKRDKTNHDYLSELFSQENYFEEMSGLTRSYEQIWYGERTLTENSFQKLASRFETVYQRLHTSSTS